MKTLANCNATDFLKQTYRISKPVSDLLKTIDFKGIISKKAVYEKDDTEEEKKVKDRIQNSQNMKTVVKTLMEKCPEETANLMGLMCFTEPEDLKNVTGIELLGACIDMMSEKGVIDFFTSLLKLAG